MMILVDTSVWKQGIQGSYTDFLICSVAINRNISIFTTDKDFQNYRGIVNLNLHPLRNQ